MATARALAVGIALVLIFLSARALFERQEGLRNVCRGIAWVGLLLAAEAFIQRALSPSLIYGVWRPAGLASNILPWGPFINRNDFAAWLLMAIPLTIGYMLMRINSIRGSSDPWIDADRLIDPRLILLLASTCVMTGAILASLSRSGVLSLAIALTGFIILARTRLGRTRLSLLAGAVGVLLIAGATYVNLPALLTRLHEAWPSGLGGRLAVWRDTGQLSGTSPRPELGWGRTHRPCWSTNRATVCSFSTTRTMSFCRSWLKEACCSEWPRRSC